MIFLKKYRESIAVSELGRIHAILPLKEMVEELASNFPKKHPQGNKPTFPPEGEIALMFFKPYTRLLDNGLIEMLNGSIHMQMFCGVLIDPSIPSGTARLSARYATGWHRRSTSSGNRACCIRSGRHYLRTRACA